MVRGTQRAQAALDAMEAFGFKRNVAKKALKMLLKENDNNWDYVETSNYSVLVEWIFDLSEETEAESQPPVQAQVPPPHANPVVEKPQDPAVPLHADPVPIQQEDTAEPEPELTETRAKGKRASEEVLLSTRGAGNGMVVKKPRLRGEASPAQQAVRTVDSHEAEEEIPLVRYKRWKRTVTMPQIKVEPDLEKDVVGKGISIEDTRHGAAVENDIQGKGNAVEETTLNVHASLPAFACSPAAGKAKTFGDGPLVGNGHTSEINSTGIPEGSKFSNGTGQELSGEGNVTRSSVEIASSETGEVKLFFGCSDLPGFRMPNMEDLLKEVEDRCLRSYKLIEPSFSLANLLKEMCSCALEMGSKSIGDEGERIVHVVPLLDSLKRPGFRTMGFTSNGCLNLQLPGGFGLPKENEAVITIKDSGNPGTANPGDANESHEPANSGATNQYVSNGNSMSPVVVDPQPLALSCVRPFCDATDIARGLERIKIPLRNDFNDGRLLPPFYYIQHNNIFQNARINFSFSRIGGDDCCSDCFGDCLAAPYPCVCKLGTGSGFAYTQGGLIKTQFLDECISAKQNPENHNLFYCRCCPVERIKDTIRPSPCKGHLIRKFVKECWNKCGCSQKCGNRVVQRGMTYNLEVFFTGQAKGWGLRTLDDLPKGAFVCEYVGEILTSTECHTRTSKIVDDARHTIPVLLDADWGSRLVVEDEEALCLDATLYGNVARFVNHRCHDANLIEIPVQVETPDCHYYHVALFTSREVEAFEELTWDYGFDFYGSSQPTFQCHCGSTYCRDA